MIYPVSWPTTANRSWPSASISATRSPARVPVSYPRSVDPVRVIRRQRVADDISGVVADHGEPLVAERIHQRDQVAGEGAGVVPEIGRPCPGDPPPARS